MRHAGWWVLVLFLMAGCAAAPAPRTTASAPAAVTAGSGDPWTAYKDALNAARFPQPSGIVLNLIPITTFTPGLEWNDSGQVLMATWAESSSWTGAQPGQTFTLPAGSDGDTWLTPYPSLLDFCEGIPSDQLSLSLAQWLGMPPDSSDDVVVQLWLDPTQFFRPCPDPEVNDSQCLVDLTVGTVDKSASCPWQDAIDDGQVSGAFATVSSAHLQWMCANWTASFTGPVEDQFPWTALGYTYNWGDPGNPVGGSEYVVPGGSTVLVQSITTVADYCQPSTRKAVQGR